jgi:hypothetical protein
LSAAWAGDGDWGGGTSVALWKPTGTEGDGARESADWENDEETSDAEQTKRLEDEKKADEREETNVAEKEPKEKEEEEKDGEKRLNFNGFYLNDLQVYLIICAIFCLFYNAARLMTDADLKNERKSRPREKRTRTPESRDV